MGVLSDRDVVLALTDAAPATRAVIEAVLDVWPDHARYMRRSLEARTPPQMAATETLAEAALLLTDDLPECAARYRWTCDRLREEELFFHREGRYRLSTFAEAEAEVYGDAAYMANYVDGLLLTQVLWYNHAASCDFFLRETPAMLAPDSRFLEIGPGHGLMTYMALRDFDLARAEAWDVSSVSLDRTRAALERLGGADVAYSVRDVMTLEPQGERFDFVVLSEVLEHLEDPKAAMRRIRHVVDDARGVVFVNVPINSPSPDHLHLMREPDDARALLTECGFVIEREAFFATQATPLERALRNRVSVSACMLARPRA
ncbi:class I SAM-dependent methyltransferase [Rubrimonas cliftonensis]|uniref:Methyltransferase domain-containing protein n=1 Tax=Rubrimonas cliftonensis TaxID=89524 RepID=A0A1H4CVK1_9RHOB|nr:class I SAM-dependent methyltransferase [Rubrimonas cliftonensis]SEA64388.1 Methyltransferase domain-containing protein [Rubrimonas cliftonensis]